MIQQQNKWEAIDQVDRDYSSTKSPDFGRGELIDAIHKQIEDTDWKAESQYHNSYRVNGKNNIGRSISMPNKKWHMLNKK